MIYQLNPALMELLVLSLVLPEDSYGYKIGQQLKKVSNLKDSALYPVLRRLSENKCVDAYDRQIQGRNRKYYKITDQGRRRQAELKEEWHDFTVAIDQIVSNVSKCSQNEKIEKEEGGEDDKERVYGAAQSEA